MKIAYTLLLFVAALSFKSSAQSLNEADKLYSNYEYAAAAQIYDAYRLDKELITPDLERLAYCYYVVGNEKKGITAYKELIKREDKQGIEHYYRLGALQKNAKQYDSAIQSFKLYQKEGGKNPVDLLIKQCEAIPSWKEIKYQRFENDPYNDEKANILIPYGGLDNISILFETGIDSAGNALSFASDKNNFAEVLLSRPFSTSENIRIPYYWLDGKNNSFSISSITIDEANNKAYFTVMEPISRDESRRGPHIYKADYTDFYTPLKNIEPWQHAGIESNVYTAQPTLSSDGKTMIFSRITSTKPDADLYISYLDNNTWSTPIVLETINTNGDEMFPVLIGDSLLTFATNGRLGYGDLDIYYTEFSYNFPSSNVQHYKAPINSSQDDFLGYWRDAYTFDFSSNRDAGKGDDDVWRMYLERPKVINQDSIAFEEFIAKWEDPKIYFGLDKDVSDESLSFLEELKQFITEQPNLEIVLIGHTDAQGSEKYNQRLGMRRVKWLLKNFEKEGIPTEHITLISVGETQLVNQCSDGVKCNETEHAKNRFAEVQLKR